MLFCHLLLFAVWKCGNRAVTNGNRAVTDKVAVLQDVSSAFLQTVGRHLSGRLLLKSPGAQTTDFDAPQYAATDRCNFLYRSRQPAVYSEDGAGAIGRLFRCQEYRDTGEIVGRTQPA